MHASIMIRHQKMHITQTNLSTKICFCKDYNRQIAAVGRMLKPDKNLIDASDHDRKLFLCHEVASLFFLFI